MSVYTVQSGDSLWKISDHFNVPFKKLVGANPQIRDLNVIHPGDAVNIPDGALATQHRAAAKEDDPFEGAGKALDDMLQELKKKAGGVMTAPKPKAAPKAQQQKKPTAQTTTSKTPAWLSLAYSEYLLWQGHLKERDYQTRFNWMKQKVLTYCGAAGMGYIDQWCSAFVNWVLQHSLTKPAGKGFVLGTHHGLAASWAAWSGGKQVAPRRGAIVVKGGYQNTWCDWCHVGFVNSWSDKYTEVTEYDQYSGQYMRTFYDISVEILGGNQGHPDGYPMNWGNSAVTKSWQSSSNGFVFIWPKWLK